MNKAQNCVVVRYKVVVNEVTSLDKVEELTKETDYYTCLGVFSQVIGEWIAGGGVIMACSSDVVRLLRDGKVVFKLSVRPVRFSLSVTSIRSAQHNAKENVSLQTGHIH